MWLPGRGVGDRRAHRSPSKFPAGAGVQEPWQLAERASEHGMPSPFVLQLAEPGETRLLS